MHRQIARRLVGVGACLSASLFMAACFPAVTHGPRIETGAALGVSIATTSGPTYVEGDDGGVHLRTGMIGAHLSYGWAPKSPNSPGFYTALTVPVLFPLAQVEVFMQTPPAWTPGFQMGIGGSVSYENTDAIAQFGKISDRGDGWFLMQGIARRDFSDYYGPSVASVSGAAYQFTRNHARSYLYVQYASGRQPGICNGLIRVCEKGDRSHALALGAAIEYWWRKKPNP